MTISALLTEATQYLNFHDLMGENSEIAFSVFGLPIRWYALAYLAGVFVGYWYLLRLIAQPGAPMARRHADDMIFYAMLGIILGGRLGYVMFYNLAHYLQAPVEILKLWDGGMSLHGGVAGVLIAIWYVTRKEKLSFLRFCDYIACVVPFGLFFGRLANFVNGELWGRPTTVPWAIIFPDSGTIDPRHPSQLYEAFSEGLLLFVLLALAVRIAGFRRPGLVAGIFAAGYAVARGTCEFFREPDPQLGFLFGREVSALEGGVTMGMLLSLPLLLAGLFLIWQAMRREPLPAAGGTGATA